MNALRTSTMNLFGDVFVVTYLLPSMQIFHLGIRIPSDPRRLPNQIYRENTVLAQEISRFKSIYTL